MSRIWSKQQQAIFGWFKNGRGNLVVRARAGTGKTTTIIEATKHAPEQFQLLAAFNKRIAKELEAKIRDNGATAEAKTLHGIGYGIITSYWERVQLDNKRGFDLAAQACGDQAPDEMIAKVQKLASMAKGQVAEVDPIALPDMLVELAELFDLEPDDTWQQEGYTTEWLCTKAAEAMELARHREDGRAPRIDFDDMIYLPVANKWAKPRYQLVIVDEAQDMNATQLALAMSVVTPDGRIAVVGDDRQAIYGFRGADSGALDRLKTELQATELGLTTTYRCGRAIVDYARELVDDFEAGPDNQPGVIKVSSQETMMEVAKPGDFVLSRINAPLVSICLKLLRAGRPARIEGKDVAAGLKRVVRNWKPRSVQDLVDRIEKWRDREIEKAKKKESHLVDTKVENIKDQAEILLALTEGIATPAELLTRLDTLFGDSDEQQRPAVVCSSIHRSKGLEADRVFILQATLYPNRKKIMRDGKCSEADALKLAKNVVEEQNLEYVAVTRAKAELVWVK